MASFSAKSFERKLKEMSSRQDSVQTVSLWLIHHRAHSKTVVNLWLEHMKKAKPDRRLVLFYLANDVIQNSRKKGKEFSQSFNKVLGDSMQYLRDTSIQPSVERVLKIWQERKVFDSHTVQKLLEQLNHVSKPKSKPKSKPEITTAKNKNDKPEKEQEKEKKKKPPPRPIPANFKAINVTHAIATMQSIEDETERQQTLVTQMRLDASSSEGIKQLKDYAGGNRFSLEFEESSTKYEDLVQSLESESQHRQSLINLLEDGNAYYEAALKEANIIANAYRSFGNRLHSMKKKLDNKIRKFATAEKEAPVSAPKASFLASGLSGILEEMNRSPAATTSASEPKEKDTAKEGESEETDKKEVNEMQDEGKDEVNEDKTVDPTMDHVEVSDMDIDSDSENGGDESEPNTAPQLSDTQSNASSVSTPKPASSAPALNTASSPVKPNLPVQNTTPQFGYTMTVNSTEDTEVSSPASHESAPSPEGSPDLNLEIYEGSPVTKTLPSSQLGVTTNQSFLAGVNSKQKSSTGSPGPQNTMTLLAQLISKKRRQNDSSSVEGTDSPDQDSSTPNTPVRDESSGRPIMNLLGNLFPKISQSVHLVGAQGDATQSGDSKNQEVLKAQVNVPVTGIVPSTVAPDSGQVEPRNPAEALSKVDSGPSTDEEGAAGDATPEHGLEFAQGPPIIIRSDASFPRPQIPPNIPGPFPGQAFQNRPPVGRPPFVSPQRMPRFPSDPGMPMRDGLRRPSIEEQLMEEQHLRELRSPRLRSPRIQGPPVEWDRSFPFGPRGNVMPVNNLGESRDPRLRRREQRQMPGRPVDGPPFMDRVPPIDMRGRPPGMEMRGAPPHDRGGPPPMGIREEIDLINREEMVRRRPSHGDEGDGPIPFEERHIREMRPGRPPMDVRPDMHLMEGERREGPFPFERHERFHPMERGMPHIDTRDGPHPMELRDGPPHMRGEMIPPMNRHHPQHRMDRPDIPVTERREFPSFDQRGPPIDQLGEPHLMDQRNEFHPPEMQDGIPQGEVPTSEEETPGNESGDKPPVGVVPQEQNPGEVYFSEGGDKRPPIEESPMEQPQIAEPENSLHNEIKFNQGEGIENEHASGPMLPPEVRPSDERSAFDIRPGFHMDDPNLGMRFPVRRDDFRPIRPMGGPFRPHHERPGRFPGPRNFHHRNFGPRNFRPRYEHEGGRPRFPPMHGGPRQKRPGPPFHPDSAKRPHY